MQQFTGIHGYDQAGLAGIGQHKARVLIAAFPLRAQLLLPLRIPCLHLAHLCIVARGSFLAQRLNGGRHDIVKILGQGNIALALHAEGGDAVTRQLRQQRAADTLNRKGKGGVLQHRHMAGLHDSFQKCALILGRYPLAQGVNIGFGIAQLCAQGAYLLGQGRVGNQFHMQMRFRHGNLSKLLYFLYLPQAKEHLRPVHLSGQEQIPHQRFKAGGRQIFLGGGGLRGVMPDMRIARALDDIQLFLGKQMPHGLKLRRLGARVDNLRGALVHLLYGQGSKHQFTARKQIAHGIAHKGKLQGAQLARLLLGHQRHFLLLRYFCAVLLYAEGLMPTMFLKVLEK